MEKLTDNNIAFCIENNCYMEMNMDELRLNLSKAPTFEELYTKLNKYEQLEQELGCPLDVFVKLISTGELWCEDERMHFDGGDYGKLVGSPKWEERFKCETAPIYFSFDDEDLKETDFWAWYHFCSNGSDHIILKLKDYGKTWALTKEELKKIKNCQKKY